MNYCTFACVCACTQASNKGEKKMCVFQSSQLPSQHATFVVCGTPLKSAKAASGQWDCSGSRGSRAANAFEIPTQNVWENSSV